MIEIAELPDSLRELKNINMRDVPQLKYVVEMSEKLCPNVGFVDTFSMSHSFNLGATYIFIKRYFQGSIDTSFKEKYVSHADLHKTLEVYGIEPTAFWYLVLFLKDYVDDESEGEKQQYDAFQKLCELASHLYGMEFCESPIDGEFLGSENKGLLRLKVGKHWIETKDDKVLYGVFCALYRYINYIERTQPPKQKALIDGVWEETNIVEYDISRQHLFTVSGKQEKEKIIIPETYRISYFTTYMKKFLKPFNTPNRDSRISKDKWLLTSRIIYIIGYSSDENYDKRYKDVNGKLIERDFLKGNYQKDRYKDEVRRIIYV